MKYNERFSKEEITHFERKIQELILTNINEWNIMVKRLRPTKITKTGEKVPGLYRHFNVVSYLNDKFKFTEKTAFRFINYLVLTPWFKVYSAEQNDSFKFDCSCMLMSKIMTSCREQTHNDDDSTPNKYMKYRTGSANMKDRVNLTVKFGVVYDKFWFVDTDGNFWPIELAK